MEVSPSARKVLGFEASDSSSNRPHGPMRRAKSALSLSLLGSGAIAEGGPGGGGGALMHSASSACLTATDSYGNLTDMDVAAEQSSLGSASEGSGQSALPSSSSQQHQELPFCEEEDEDKPTPALEIPYTR